ncbi:MAG TPA: hypothetical protein PLV70_01820 [Flavobacteriales bacterium]|nr:hypothetical protein [Flavobacteriales bacterium]
MLHAHGQFVAVGHVHDSFHPIAILVVRAEQYLVAPVIAGCEEEVRSISNFAGQAFCMETAQMSAVMLGTLVIDVVSAADQFKAQSAVALVQLAVFSEFASGNFNRVFQAYFASYGLAVTAAPTANRAAPFFRDTGHEHSVMLDEFCFYAGILAAHYAAAIFFAFSEFRAQVITGFGVPVQGIVIGEAERKTIHASAGSCMMLCSVAAGFRRALARHGFVTTGNTGAAVAVSAVRV